MSIDIVLPLEIPEQLVSTWSLILDTQESPVHKTTLRVMICHLPVMAEAAAAGMR